MEAARAAVSKITGRTGHRTDVDEVVNPAVTSETIKPHRHEETTEAVDREVHQDHYHTTVQPISHRETLPEKHTHNALPQVSREFRHDNEQETKSRVSAELGQFANTSRTHETRHTASAAPQVVGEHVHHHVHETVQPVIHKETIQPEVVHTTVPIHETHHESSKHHGMSALPMKTLDEFTKAGGLISGTKSHTHEEYEGAPRPYNESLKTSIEKVLPGHHGHSSTTGTTGTTGMTGTTGSGLTGHNTTGTGYGSNTSGSGLTGHNTTGTGLTGHNTTGTGLTGHNTTGSGYGSNAGSGLTGHNTSSSGYGSNPGYGSNTSGYDSNNRAVGSGLDSNTSGYDRRPDSGVGVSQSEGQHTKPSLMDKLNPRVDANGDGKAGFMK